MRAHPMKGYRHKLDRTRLVLEKPDVAMKATNVFRPTVLDISNSRTVFATSDILESETSFDSLSSAAATYFLQ